MLAGAVPEIQAVQIPLLSAMLLGGCAAKLTRIVRVGSLDAGLGPTALFPLRLRRPIAVATCAAEFGCGVGLIVTAGAFGHGGPANAVRFLTALLFIVATCALIELRTSHPGTGCGCFGEFSRTPVSGRTLARAALLAVAALATIGLPPLHLPRPGLEAVRLGLILAAELVVIAVLSPELGEALVRLGYSEPCELRRLPAVRTLTALRRSSQWRRRGPDHRGRAGRHVAGAVLAVRRVSGPGRPHRRRDRVRGAHAPAPPAHPRCAGGRGHGRGAGLARRLGAAGPAAADLAARAAAPAGRLRRAREQPPTCRRPRPASGVGLRRPDRTPRHHGPRHHGPGHHGPLRAPRAGAAVHPADPAGGHARPARRHTQDPAG
jgi:hypothetical protein